MSEQSTVVTPRAVAPAAADGKMTRRRRIGVWSLVILASFIGLVSILTTFVNRQLLDNTSWNKASAKVIQDPQVRSAVSTQLVNQLYNNVDVSAQLQTRLPKNLQPLAAPAAGALREPATKAVEFLLAQPRFQQLFIDASTRRAPEARQRAREQDRLRDRHRQRRRDAGRESAADRSSGSSSGCRQSALDKLPPDAGVITIMSSDQLSYAQQGVRAVKVAERLATRPRLPALRARRVPRAR